MNKVIFGSVFTAFVLLVSVPTNIGCAPIDPCGAGEKDCGDGTCTEVERICCGGGLSCPGGTVCGPDATCIDSRIAGCVESGQKPCFNWDGSIDCASSLSAVCCGDHRNCPMGTVCSSDGTSCLP